MMKAQIIHLLDLRDNPLKLFAWFESLGVFDHSMALKFAVQYNLWGGIPPEKLLAFYDCCLELFFELVRNYLVPWYRKAFQSSLLIGFFFFCWFILHVVN